MNGLARRIHGRNYDVWVDPNLSAEIDKDVKAFLEKGGKITVIDNSGRPKVEPDLPLTRKQLADFKASLGMKSFHSVHIEWCATSQRYLAWLRNEFIGGYTSQKSAMDAVRKKVKMVQSHVEKETSCNQQSKKTNKGANPRVGG